MKKSEREGLKREALEQLKRLAPRGCTIYTVLRAVSSSGMSRVISLYTFVDGRPVYLDGYIARILGCQRKSIGRTGEGLYVTGAGMDMGYYIVHELGYAVYKDGYAFKHEWL